MAGINTGFSSQLYSGLLAARGINSTQINGGIQAAIAGQNQANKANQQRYDQGLSTLQGGSDKAAGLLQSATDQIGQNGQAAANRINLQEQQGKGNATNSAVSRGLTDTTISDAMQRGVSRDANDARLANQELVNRQQAQAKDAQAAQASQGSGAISNFIAARNDNGPDMGLLSQMIMGAASDPKTQRTGQVVRNSVPGLGGAAGNNGLPSNFGQAPNPSTNGYTMSPGGAVPYGQQSANFAGSMGNSASAPAPAPGGVQSALSPAGADSSISNAITGGAAGASLANDAKATSPWMTNMDDAAAAVKASAMADGGSKPPSEPSIEDTTPWMGNAQSGTFTKSEWNALQPWQQQNVLAGRKVSYRNLG